MQSGIISICTRYNSSMLRCAELETFIREKEQEIDYLVQLGGPKKVKAVDYTKVGGTKIAVDVQSYYDDLEKLLREKKDAQMLLQQEKLMLERTVVSLNNCTSLLGKTKRVVFIERFVHRKSVKDISNFSGVTVKTVKNIMAELKKEGYPLN